MKVLFALGIINLLSVFVQGNWIFPMELYAQPNYPIAFAHPPTPDYTPTLYGNTEGQIISPPHEASARDIGDAVIYLHDLNARNDPTPAAVPLRRDTGDAVIYLHDLNARNDPTPAAVPLRSDDDLGRNLEKHDASNRYTVYSRDGDGRRKQPSQDASRYEYRDRYQDRDRERDEDRRGGKKSYYDRERGRYSKDELDREDDIRRGKSKSRKQKSHQHHKHHNHQHHHDRDEKRAYGHSRMRESGERERGKLKRRPHFLNAPEDEEGKRYDDDKPYLDVSGDGRSIKLDKDVDDRKRFGSISLGGNRYDADKPYLDVTDDGRSIKVDKDVDARGIYISATGLNAGPVSASGVSTDGKDVVVKTKSIANR